MKKINITKIAPLFIILSMFSTFSNSTLIENESTKEKKEFSLIDICKDYPYCKMSPSEEKDKDGN